MTKKRKVDVRAAGALVWRQVGPHMELLVVHRPEYNDWSFPKGKVKGEEELRATCRRELFEETGVDIVLGQPIGWSRYELPSGKWKETRYWIATPADEDYTSPGPKTGQHLRSAAHNYTIAQRRMDVPEGSTDEVDEVRWVQIGQLAKLLSYKSDRTLLNRFKDQSARSLLNTQPLLLVRHARAKKRSAWKGGKGSEDTRPLTNIGGKRAVLMADVMRSYGVETLVSSPWKRCWDTFAPYAEGNGIDIKAVEALTEHAHKSDPAAFAHFIRKTIKKLHVPTAMCLHRPTLPTVMDEVKDFATRAVMRQIPKKDPWLKPGEMIIAHIANEGGRGPIVVALEKMRPII